MGGVALIAIITVVLVLLLKDDKKPDPGPSPPSPPDPDIPHFNPYVVYYNDSNTMSYKLRINPNLKDSFQFPFNDTFNNYKFTNISLNGNNAFASGKTLKFTFKGDQTQARDDVRVHKKKSPVPNANPSLNLNVDIGTQFNLNVTDNFSGDLILST